jgi:predicted AAA+ superfamily ATPase
MLENIVFIELKRRNEEVFYYKENKECDFIVRSRTKTLAAIQVCLELADPQTKAREIDGLIEAMEQFSLHEGYIITSSETEVIHIENNGKPYLVHVIPVWRWLLNITS